MWYEFPTPVGPLIGTPWARNSYLFGWDAGTTARSHSMGGSHGSCGSHSCHRLGRCRTHLLLCQSPRVAAAAYVCRGFLAQRRLVARARLLGAERGAASRMSLPSRPSSLAARDKHHEAL